MKINNMKIFGIMICIALIGSPAFASAYSNTDSNVISVYSGESDIYLENGGEMDAMFSMDMCLENASKADLDMHKKLLDESNDIYDKHKEEYAKIDKLFDDIKFDDDKAWDAVSEKANKEYAVIDKKVGLDKINAKIQAIYDKNNCEEFWDNFEGSEIDLKMTDEQAKEAESINNKIDQTYKNHEGDYEELDKKQADLNKEYEALDKKSGITKLFEKLNSLWNSIF